MKKKQAIKKQQEGVSLIELMIAMLLSLIVISGVVMMVSQLRQNARLLSTEAEMQENLSFAGNRLGFAFKSAFSSPCGNLSEMLGSGELGTSSLLKRAYTYQGGTITPQPMNHLIMGTPVAPFATTIRHQDFPMFSVGIVGYKEATINGHPVSSLLTSPRSGTNYVMLVEISERILLNTGSVRGVRGGLLAKPPGVSVNNPPITTSHLPDRLVGRTGVPFIITDCHQGDLFKSSTETSKALTKTTIPVDDDLFFSGVANGYRDAETVIAPLGVYVYYLRHDSASGEVGLARRDLMSSDDEMLVPGLTDWQLSWGLAGTDELSVQAYFTTKQIIDAAMPIADFRRYLVSIRSDLTLTGQDNRYRLFGDKTEYHSLSGQRAYTIRNKMQRR